MRKENAAEAQRAALNKLRDDFNRFCVVKPWWREEELTCFAQGRATQYGITAGQAGITQERARALLESVQRKFEPQDDRRETLVVSWDFG